MEYTILVNGRPKKTGCHVYKFNYGSVKDIKLSISEGKFSVELQMKVKKSADEIFTDKNNCFSEAMKKGMLFHILLYSKALSTDDIKILIDGEEELGWNPEKSPIIYSLVTGKLVRGFPAEWQEKGKVFVYFLETHKSGQSSLAASLYALLYSKAKDSETERFQYLWMSMNGLYNHLSALVLSGNDLFIEKKKIQILEEIEDWGTGTVSREENKEVARAIGRILKKPNFERPDLEELLKAEFKTVHPKDERDGINLNGYLNLWYPYYLRCNMFHASQPIALFSLDKEIEIRRLNFINNRLEDYLDHNLLKYFDDEYCKLKINRMKDEH